MKTIKFIGTGEHYQNVMTEEGDSICKLWYGGSQKRSIKSVDGRLYLYLEGNDEPVGVFAETIYWSTFDITKIPDGFSLPKYIEVKPKSWRDLGCLY